MRRSNKIVAILIVAILVIGAVGCRKLESRAIFIEWTDNSTLKFAREKEAEHDALGREHIEIADDAETVEVEGVVFKVVRTEDDFDDIDNDLAGNYIMANDIAIHSMGVGNINEKPNNTSDKYMPFTGVFHGNNYKIKGMQILKPLFPHINGATIQNVVISSERYHSRNFGISESPLVGIAYNSKIKNCINYFYVPYKENATVAGIARRVENSEVVGCGNYTTQTSAGVVGAAVNSILADCINYGDIIGTGITDASTSYIGGGGGIVGTIIKDIKIKSCKNYGRIISSGGAMGGIAGVAQFEVLGEEAIDNRMLNYDQVIKDCTNYGDLYLRKHRSDVTTVEFVRGTDLQFAYIGGIAGAVARVENSVNHGNIYGFENIGSKVNYAGGVVGLARSVENSVSHGTFTVQRRMGINVGAVAGKLI